MNSFVNLLKVLRFHSCQCLWRKGSLKIRIHFLRQLRRMFALANADVVMLVGARLNWLLAHGKGWAADTMFYSTGY